MKKHPVDDLFKRRLGDLEKKPSSDAWLKIQERSKTQRRVAVGWIWYAAASVLIAAMAGYMVWQNDSNELINPDKSGKTIAKVEAKKSAVEKSEDHSLDSKDRVAEADKKENINPVEKAISLQEKGKSSTENHDVENESSIHIENESVAILERKQLDISDDIHEVSSIGAKIEEGKILPEVSAVSQVDKQAPEPTRTIVVAVETNAVDEVDDKPKNSRFSRVFRQLKNARAGERVDWEEVGFNPKTLVAKVDDRLHNREDKESEKYQTPKERTKL